MDTQHSKLTALQELLHWGVAETQVPLHDTAGQAGAHQCSEGTRNNRDTEYLTGKKGEQSDEIKNQRAGREASEQMPRCDAHERVKHTAARMRLISCVRLFLLEDTSEPFPKLRVPGALWCICNNKNSKEQEATGRIQKITQHTSELMSPLHRHPVH